MKEFITHKHKKKNISIVTHSFTDDEKEELELILKKYDNSTVQHFISELEELCSEMIILVKHTNRKAVKKRKYQMIGHFEKALADLKYIESLKNMRENWEDLKSVLAEDYSRLVSVMFTIDNLEELITLLKKDEIPTGNRVDPFGFVTTIAEMFNLYFEKPKKTPDGKKIGTGAFFNVARISLNAVGYNIDDCKNHVNLAIENLNKTLGESS